MSVVIILTTKEFRDGLRNRWLAATTLILLGLALGLAFLGSAPVGHVGASPLAVTVVSLASLTVFLLPLMALMLAFDAVVGEAERGTLLLLLSYPVRRWQIVVGKFLGHTALLAVATIVGYGAAGVAIAIKGGVEQWPSFVVLVASSVALGAVFLALGYLASTCVRERATAAGLAVGLWLLLVLLYDLVLLGVLAATQGQGAVGALFPWVLLVNPADVFRLLNLTGFGEVRQFSGLAGLAGDQLVRPAALVAALVAWVAVPLAVAILAFRRRPL
ncbi:MAG TPA: ABC transporter permease subunit [Magnetospirillum sp.]|nr:ABC transporter permease subunit [Magnetospirillum sp.]